MAKTIEQIQEEVQQIKNETVAKQNTATRVGGALEDIVDHVEHYISDVADRGVAEAVAAVEAKAQSIDKLTGDVATLGLKVGELSELETTDKSTLVKAINEVQGIIDGTTHITTTTRLSNCKEDKYWAILNYASVGNVENPFTPTADIKLWSSPKLEVKAGDVVKISTFGGSGGRAYAITDTNSVILERAEANADLLGDKAITRTISQDGYLYVNCNSIKLSNTNDFYVDVTRKSQSEGIIGRLSVVETKTDEVSNVVADVEEKVDGLSNIISQTTLEPISVVDGVLATNGTVVQVASATESYEVLEYAVVPNKVYNISTQIKQGDSSARSFLCTYANGTFLQSLESSAQKVMNKAFTFANNVTTIKTYRNVIYSASCVEVNSPFSTMIADNADKINDTKRDIGDVSKLATTTKSSAVDAINELKNTIDESKYEVKNIPLQSCDEDVFWAILNYASVSGKTAFAPTDTIKLYASPKLEVKAGDVVKISTFGGSGGRAYAITDTNSVILERAEANADLLGDKAITKTIAQDGFLYVNCNVRKLNSTEDFYVNVKSQKREGGFSVDGLLNQIYVSEEGEILRLNTSPSLISIIHKWGFVGGSTSSGEMEWTKDGAFKWEDMYEYSIGQRLMKINGVEGYNFSVGGQTAKGWCSEVSSRTWSAAQKEENLKQAYIIDLGANDVKNTSIYSGGIGNVSTDIDWDDYNNNADTFVGWYAGLIQRLLSVVAKPYIFVMTSRKYMYNPSSSYAQQAYPKILEIYEFVKSRYGRVYLVDNYKYGYPNTTPYQSILMSGGHPSTIGYQLESFIVNTLIDDIIRRNYADFKEACFAIDGRQR